jgi:hypothetical protein
MNILAYGIMRVTGYRFPKYGLFGRDTKSREILQWIGINPIFLNIRLPDVPEL